MLICKRVMLVGMIVASLKNPLGALYALYACRKKYPPAIKFFQYPSEYLLCESYTYMSYMIEFLLYRLGYSVIYLGSATM